MYTKTVRLPYTLWYDGHDKIFRMDMSTILPEEHYEDHDTHSAEEHPQQ